MKRFSPFIELVIFLFVVLPIFIIVGMPTMTSIIVHKKCPGFKNDKLDCSKCHRIKKL